MKECDKWNSLINNKLHMIYLSSNNDRHPVTKTFNTLVDTSVFPFKLLPVTLHYPLIWLIYLLTYLLHEAESFLRN